MRPSRPSVHHRLQKPTHALIGIPLLLSACNIMTPDTTPPPAFAPTVLEISPDAGSGPDYAASGSIESAEDVDYFELVVAQAFNSVVVMTAGATDTAGQVETEQRAAITAECEGERHKSEPPCVWGYDADVDTPHPDRTEEFNTMPASKNFLWEGNLGKGTYYIRVTGENGATGDYELTVELGNQDCPTYYCD